MAIDTEAKRRSVGAYAFAYVSPPADASIDESDRAAAAGLYSGIDYADAALASYITAGPLTMLTTRAVLTNIAPTPQLHVVTTED